MTLRLGVLISGRGSNLQALIDACEAPDYPASIALVVSNRSDAAGLDRAEQAGLKTTVVDHRDFGDAQAFAREIDTRLREANVQLVCLAGFMRIIANEFVDAWADRLINIHPSLLPAFPGLKVHERALAAGVRISGCTVHFVRPEVDSGPIILQSAVPVLPKDTPDTLAARILTKEHQCYPNAVRLIAEGRVKIDGDRTVIDDEKGYLTAADCP